MKESFVFKHLDKILFAIMVAVAAFVYGVAVGEFKLFPYSTARQGAKSARDLYQNWRSYAGIEPTKYLHPARVEGKGVTVNDPQRAFDGLTLMSGLFDQRVALQLIDMDGKVVHRWVPEFDRLLASAGGNLPKDERPFNEWDAGVMGVELLPDGSMVLNYSGMGIKLDKCSKPEWVLDYSIHHSIMRSEDGTFWASGRRMVREPEKRLPEIEPPFVEDVAVQFSPSGEVLREIPLGQMLIDNDLEAAFYPTGTHTVQNNAVDYTHLNDVEVLPRDYAPQFPMFEAGDILVSLRNLNLLFVFDPDTLKIKWHQTGPWMRQHDPDFLPDGTIAVLNNRNDDTQNGAIFGGSNIMVVDPKTGQTRIVYQGRPDRPFYTNYQGNIQYLPNGDFLITETKGGRLFEVDKDGDIVWEFVSRYDESQVSQVQDGARFPRDYFTVDDWSCN